MEFWLQRDDGYVWLYREAPGGGYRVARFEDDEECQHFAEWFVLRVVPSRAPYQTVLPIDWTPGAASI